MAGRPTSWSEELEDKAWEYVNGGWQEQGDAVPMVVGLCCYIDRSKSIIYDWAKDERKKFSDIIGKIAELQESVTFNKSLTGEYNATMAKLLLTKHGYSDKVDSELTGPNGGAIKTDNTWTIKVVE